MASRRRTATPANGKKPVVGYVRVSTEEQAVHGVSLAAQAAKLEAYASLYDLELVAVVEDAGVSAKSLDRPGVTRVLDMVRSGTVEGILVAKLDRLTRSVVDLAGIVELVAKKGAALLSVAENIDTGSAGGRMVLNMLGVLGQWEREVIAERTQAGMQQKKAQGEVYARVPYGYTSGPEVAEAGRTYRRLVPVAEQQAVIARIRASYADGQGTRRIAAALNSDGVPTQNGGSWLPSTVQRILDRPAVEAVA